MIILDLSSLSIKNEKGIELHKIDLNIDINKNVRLYNLANKLKEKNVVNTFSNWFLRGMLVSNYNIVLQTLKYLEKDNSILLKNCSLIEHSPIWNSFGESNITFFSNFSGCSSIIQCLFELNDIKVKKNYNLYYSIISLLNIFSRFIITFVVSILLFFRYSLKLPYKKPKNNLNWFISRGIIHSKNWYSVTNNSNLAYLNSWFRPWQNSKFLKSERKSFWLGNLISGYDVLKSIIKCLVEFGFINSYRYGLILPYVQMNLYGISVSRLNNKFLAKSVTTFEVFYPFNKFLNFDSWNLYVMIVLPFYKSFKFVPKHGNIYFSDFNIYKEQKNVGNIESDVVFKEIKFKNNSFKNNYKSVNCVFFTQPMALENELIIIDQVYLLCKKLKLKLFLQIHPRSKKAHYKNINKNISIVDDYNQLESIRFAFIRNSTVGVELSKQKIPTFLCLWGTVKDQYAFSNSKFVRIIKEYQHLNQVINEF